MSRKKDPFWKAKPLNEMTPDEWESLCDGCGTCCLEKIEDEETGEIKTVGVSCEFLDTQNRRCLEYADRKTVNPDCIVLSPDNVSRIDWMPETCAYRRLAEGKSLEWWHPLISGEPDTVHRAEISIHDRVVSGGYVNFEDDP